jgi:hypothetical protein
MYRAWGKYRFAYVSAANCTCNSPTAAALLCTATDCCYRSFLSIQLPRKPAAMFYWYRCRCHTPSFIFHGVWLPSPPTPAPHFFNLGNTGSFVLQISKQFAVEIQRLLSTAAALPVAANHRRTVKLPVLHCYTQKPFENTSESRWLVSIE